MDEAMIYNSVPRVVWVMFAWSLVGAGIALVTLHLVNEISEVTYTPNTQGGTIAPPRKSKGKKRTARKPRKSKSAA